LLCQFTAPGEEDENRWRRFHCSITFRPSPCQSAEADWLAFAGHGDSGAVERIQKRFCRRVSHEVWITLIQEGMEGCSASPEAARYR